MRYFLRKISLVQLGIIFPQKTCFGIVLPLASYGPEISLLLTNSVFLLPQCWQTLAYTVSRLIVQSMMERSKEQIDVV